MKGQFGPKGALFDGWESKRHNPTFDWAILKLGAPGHLIGFDIDTANFNGNEAPEASVEAMFSVNGVPDEKSAEVTPMIPLSGSSWNARRLILERAVDRGPSKGQLRTQLAAPFQD